MKNILSFLLLISVLTFSITGIAAEKVENAKCTICHSKPEFKHKRTKDGTQSLYIDQDKFLESVHGKRKCTDCHSDVTEIPHAKELQKVRCVKCHYMGNVFGAPNIKKYREYEESVHGKLVREGNKKAPRCQDCHGSHEIRGPDDPDSQVYKTNVPKDCGKCHEEEYKVYQESVHGQAIAHGILDAPVCTDCHGEHNILRPTNPKSSVYATNIVKTCPKCHAQERIMSKYGIMTEQVATYKDSFHGIANKFGSTMVANCSSCHGYHDIRSPDDPKSSIYPSNLPKTCGKVGCHPGASKNFAKGRIHVSAHKRESGTVFWVAFGFKWLTILTMAALGAHIAMDLFKKWHIKRAS